MSITVDRSARPQDPNTAIASASATALPNRKVTMTVLQEQIVNAAYPLFVRSGIQAVTVEEIRSAAKVTTAEFDHAFSSRDAVAELCLGRREQDWTIEVVEAGARSRGTTPEGTLLAIFDVFNDWFHRDDYEACTFVNVLLEMGAEHPLGRASAAYLLNIRKMVETLATEAHLSEPERFAFSWHILMKGSIINAAEGDQKAAARAKEMARDLIARHRSQVVTAHPIDASEIENLDWLGLDGYGEDIQVRHPATAAPAARSASPLLSASVDAVSDFLEFDEFHWVA